MSALSDYRVAVRRLGRVVADVVTEAQGDTRTVPQTERVRAASVAIDRAYARLHPADQPRALLTITELERVGAKVPPPERAVAALADLSAAVDARAGEAARLQAAATEAHCRLLTIGSLPPGLRWLVDHPRALRALRWLRLWRPPVLHVDTTGRVVGPDAAPAD